MTEDIYLFMNDKILLIGINAKYSHTNPAIRYLKNYCGEDRIEIREYTINNDMDMVLSDLLSHEAGVYAFSVYIWNVSYVYSLCDSIRKASEAYILLGGPEVTYDAGTALEHSDFVMLGEGEKAFDAFQKTYFAHGDLKTCPSLCYMDGERMIHNRQSEPVDLETVEEPYFDIDDLKGRLIYYESSRGCPFSCAYCLSSSDKNVRYTSIEKVKKDLRKYIDAGAMKVKFVDRTFNAVRKRAADIIRFVTEEGRDTEFHFEIAADLIDEDFIDAVNHSKKGKLFLEIGLQSTYLPTLRAINRVQDIAYTENVVRRMLLGHRANIHLDLIAGLPLEDYVHFKRSFDDCMAMMAPVVQLGFLKVLKGSPMEKMTERYGIRYCEQAPYEVISTDAISSSELDELRRVEYFLERIYNSGLYYHFVHRAAHVEGSYFDFFEKMIANSDSAGTDPKKLTEQDMAHILFEYAESTGDRILIDCFKLDWYLRKGRAYLSADIERPEDWKKDFYRKMPEALRVRLPKNKRPWHYSRIEKFSFDVKALTEDLELREGEYIYFFDYCTGEAPEITEIIEDSGEYIVK